MRPHVPLRCAGVVGDVGGRLAREGAQDGGPRVLHVVHARPLRRHAARADGRDLRRGRSHRDVAHRACSCSATTTSTRPSSPRRPRPSTCSPTAGSSSGSARAGMQTDYDAVGLPYDSAGTRVERLEEAVADRQGRVGRRPVRLRRHALHDHAATTACPKPVQQPHPPILLGGGAQEDAAARRARGRHRRHQPEPACAARSPTTRSKSTVVEVTQQKLDWVREGAGGPLRRPRAPDPLLLRRDHRRPARTRRRGRARLRARARRRPSTRRSRSSAPSTTCATGSSRAASSGASPTS